MAQWQAHSQAARFTVTKAAIGIGLVVLLAGFHQVECPLGEIFSLAARMVFGALPSVVLAAVHGWQGNSCDHGWIWEGVSQISGCGWPVLLSLAWAV